MLGLGGRLGAKSNDGREGVVEREAGVVAVSMTSCVEVREGGGQGGGGTGIMVGDARGKWSGLVCRGLRRASNRCATKERRKTGL